MASFTPTAREAGGLKGPSVLSRGILHHLAPARGSDLGASAVLELFLMSQTSVLVLRF